MNFPDKRRAALFPIDRADDYYFQEAYHMLSSLHGVNPCSIHKQPLPQNRIITKRRITK